jgi:hypothetical protein
MLSRSARRSTGECIVYMCCPTGHGALETTTTLETPTTGHGALETTRHGALEIPTTPVRTECQVYSTQTNLSLKNHGSYGGATPTRRSQRTLD